MTDRDYRLYSIDADRKLAEENIDLRVALGVFRNLVEEQNAKIHALYAEIERRKATARPWWRLLIFR